MLWIVISLMIAIGVSARVDDDPLKEAEEEFCMIECR